MVDFDNDPTKVMPDRSVIDRANTEVATPDRASGDAARREPSTADKPRGDTGSPKLDKVGPATFRSPTSRESTLRLPRLWRVAFAG